MEKSADFIRKKEFHIVFKGYKPEEVDKFLDILSVEFDRLLKRNRELQDSLDKLKFENTEEDTDIKKVIQDALISAHKVAEEIKVQAKKEADLLIEQRKSREDQFIHDLEMKKLQMEETMIVLQGKYDDFKNKIKKTVSGMSQFIDEVNTGFNPEAYNDTGFPGIKFNSGSDFEQSMDDGLRSDTEGTFTPETEGIVESGEKEKSQYEAGKVNEASEETGLNVSEEAGRNASVFDNYNINSERDSGYYFERMQNQEKETETEFFKDPGAGYESDAEPKNETEKADDSDDRQEAEDDSVLKRERKKIDIANPDIIENFFRASDD